MKYLITGGAGFIGSNLVNELIKENEVVVIDNFNDVYEPDVKNDNIKDFIDKSNFKLYEIDMLDKEKIDEVFKKEKYFDYCIHLAGVGGVRASIENPRFYYENNVIATLNLLEVMNIYDVRNIIYFSSSSVYGNLNKEKFSELDACDFPISPYAAAKKSSEVLLYSYFNNYKFKVIIFRPFTVYGPKMRPDLAISKFTKAMINNEKIYVYGDGTSIRDYTNVKDVISAVMSSINYMENDDEVYEIINVASSNPISLNLLIETLSEVLGVVPNIEYSSNQVGDVKRTYADITKAYNLLNYTPKVDFKDGIKEFVDWYKSNEKSK